MAGGALSSDRGRAKRAAHAMITVEEAERARLIATVRVGHALVGRCQTRVRLRARNSTGRPAVTAPSDDASGPRGTVRVRLAQCCDARAEQLLTLAERARPAIRVRLAPVVASAKNREPPRFGAIAERLPRTIRVGAAHGEQAWAFRARRGSGARECFAPPSRPVETTVESGILIRRQDGGALATAAAGDAARGPTGRAIAPRPTVVRERTGTGGRPAVPRRARAAGGIVTHPTSIAIRTALDARAAAGAPCGWRRGLPPTGRDQTEYR
jgi:hypothetical protein